jgi:nicotinamide mononucleotide transporter
MSPIEIAAFVLGLVNVTLIVRRSLWNYPFGLLMVALYGWIFFGAKLYSDAILQVFFFVVQVYGWGNWSRSAATLGEVRVERMSFAARVRWLAGSMAAIAIWGWGMHRFTDAAFPWWDAAVAMLSVAAQILMSRRLIENWALWIAVDVLAIGLYAAKDLWLTALLYAIFLFLAIWGLIGWHATERRPATA